MKVHAIALVSILSAAACQGPGPGDSATPGDKSAGPAKKAAAADTPAPTPVPTPVPTPEPIVVPPGTTLVLVFGSSVSSATARAGDAVTARLGEDVKVGDEVVLPADSVVKGRVVSATRSGKVKGRAELHVEFDTIEVKGRSYAHRRQRRRPDRHLRQGSGCQGDRRGGGGRCPHRRNCGRRLRGPEGRAHRRRRGDGRSPPHPRQGSGLRAGLTPPSEAREGPSPALGSGPFGDGSSPAVRSSTACRRPRPRFP